MRYDTGGSGSIALDASRDTFSAAAAYALSTGRSLLTKSTDHLTASDTCAEVIARKANDPLKTGTNVLEQKWAPDAIHKLRSGFGHHKAQADHVGNNSCVQVIAGASN